MNVVNLDLGSRSYSIYIGKNSLSKLCTLLTELAASDRIGVHAVIISDNNVAGHYLPQVTDQLEHLRGKVDSIVVPAGEKSKSVRQIEMLWEKMVAIGTNRSSTIFALIELSV